MFRTRLRRWMSEILQKLLAHWASIGFWCMVVGLLLGLGWVFLYETAHNLREEKDCQPYRDIASRDVPMRCMHYWMKHDHN